MLCQLPTDVLSRIGCFDLVPWKEFSVCSLENNPNASCLKAVGEWVEEEFVIGARHPLCDLCQLFEGYQRYTRYAKVLTPYEDIIDNALLFDGWSSLDSGLNASVDLMFALTPALCVETSRDRTPVLTARVIVHARIHLNKSTHISTIRYGWRLASGTSVVEKKLFEKK